MFQIPVLSYFFLSHCLFTNKERFLSSLYALFPVKSVEPKSSDMKKNLIILGLVLTNVVFISFAIIQKMEAERQTAIAEKQLMIAEQFRAFAHEAQAQAERSRVSLTEALHEAEFQRKIAEQHLSLLQKQAR